MPRSSHIAMRTQCTGSFNRRWPCGAGCVQRQGRYISSVAGGTSAAGGASAAGGTSAAGGAGGSAAAARCRASFSWYSLRSSSMLRSTCETSPGRRQSHIQPMSATARDWNTTTARSCTGSMLQSPASCTSHLRIKPGEHARRVRAPQVGQQRATPCRAPPRPQPSCQSQWPARHTCTALASARHRPCLCASSGSARPCRAARAGPHALLGLQLVQHLLQLLDGELEQPARALCLSAGSECLAACCQFCQSRHTC